MNGNDWNRLEDLWQQSRSSSVPEELLRYVRREEQRQFAYVAFERLLVVVFLTWGGWWLVTGDGRETLFGMLIVSLTLIAVAFSVASRRGLRTPVTQTVQGYLDRSTARIAVGWRTLRYSWAVFAIELVVFGALEYASISGWIPYPFTGDPWFLSGLMAAFAVVLLAWSGWYARVLRTRERALAALRAQIEQSAV